MNFPCTGLIPNHNDKFDILKELSRFLPPLTTYTKSSVVVHYPSDEGVKNNADEPHNEVRTVYCVHRSPHSSYQPTQRHQSNQKIRVQTSPRLVSLMPHPLVIYWGWSLLCHIVYQQITSITMILIILRLWQPLTFAATTLCISHTHNILSERLGLAQSSQ